jgi:hypothetical protein
LFDNGVLEREGEKKRRSKDNENMGKAIDPKGSKGLDAKDSPRLLQK